MDGSIGFSTTQSVQFYPFVYLSSKINFLKFFEHRGNFLLKKKRYEFIKKNLQLNRSEKIELNTPFIPLQNEPSAILVGQNSGSHKPMSAGTRHFSGERL